MSVRLAIAASALIVSATSFAAKEPLGAIESVLEVPNLTKEQIYTKSKAWIAKKFVSANDVIQFDDKETGSMLVKGMADFPCSGWRCIGLSDYRISFTIKIDTKDGRVRTIYSDFLQVQRPAAQVSMGFPIPPTPIFIEYGKTETTNYVNKLNQEMKSYLESGDGSSGDNW